MLVQPPGDQAVDLSPPGGVLTQLGGGGVKTTAEKRRATVVEGVRHGVA
ncbi:MAG: hypothetical protein Q4F64_05150 [Corynebacterium casei]|nr:hypothetical protein [Corynebacterium casei]